MRAGRTQARALEQVKCLACRTDVPLTLEVDSRVSVKAPDRGTDMALFVVRHQHDAERCPATDANAGAKLLNHLSRTNVRQQGIEIQGEAVVQGEHTFYLILESSDADRVGEFMKPFAAAGKVEIFPASTCARVVANGGCASPLPELHGAEPAVDPDEACQRAIEAGLVVHRAHPLNCETSIPALIGGVVMPNAHFYVRNHFQIPRIDGTTWRLRIGGNVERPLSLGLHDLKNMRSESIIVTLECAGNGRSMLSPPAEGEKWELGAVSTAEWTGVPLREVLDQAGVEATAEEVLFRGADRGLLPGSTAAISFERSLSLGDSMSSGALLAYAMNGEPLPIQHGFPLRVIVPGWYAVTSVKWLTDIEILDHPFAGHYQRDAYYDEVNRDGQTVRDPVSLQRVRSLIVEPRAGQSLDRGEIAIRGVAWSGAAPIARVEVSIADGPWQQARLLGERNRQSWQWWELMARLDTRGASTIRARACDLAGRIQPEDPQWNRLGYGNNSIQKVNVQIL